MSQVEESIEVNVPVSAAYNQWTQFESFPRFMEGVERIEQRTQTLTHWKTKIAGVEREFDAEMRPQALQAVHRSPRHRDRQLARHRLTRTLPNAAPRGRAAEGRCGCPVGPAVRQPAAGCRHPPEQDEGGAVALPSVRLQQLKHLLVGAAAGVADLDGQVEVAEGRASGRQGYVAAFLRRRSTRRCRERVGGGSSPPAKSCLRLLPGAGRRSRRAGSRLLRPGATPGSAPSARRRPTADPHPPGTGPGVSPRNGSAGAAWCSGRCRW